MNNIHLKRILRTGLKSKKYLIFLFLGLLVVMILYFAVKYITFDTNNLKFSAITTEGVFLLKDRVISEEVKYLPVKLSEIPRYCKEGIIAVEDKSFYSNIGADANGIFRSIVLNLSNKSGGGSTITQQVIKNLNQDIYDRSFFVRINEIIYAIKLTLTRQKDEILEMYLNHVYFGNYNYGIASASLDYFSKSINELNLAECAYLVGIPQMPNVYNPYENRDMGKERQKIVLDLMLKNNIISEEEFSSALKHKLEFSLN